MSLTEESVVVVGQATPAKESGNWARRWTVAAKIDVVERSYREDHTRLAEECQITIGQLYEWQKAARLAMEQGLKESKINYILLQISYITLVAFIVWMALKIAGEPLSILNLAENLASEILIAGVVCFIVVRYVESWSKHEQIQITRKIVEEVGNNVFGAMLNMNFPAKMTEVIHETMIRTDVYRSRLVLEFEIERDENDPDKLVVTVKSKFVLKNISHFRKFVPIKQFIPVSDKLSHQSKVIGIYIGGKMVMDESTKPKNIYVGQEKEGQSPVGLPLTGFLWEVEDNLAPDEEKEIEIVYQLRCLDRDSYHWASHFCTEEVDISVSCRVPGIKYIVIPSKRDKIKSMRVIRKEGPHLDYEYNLGGPLLPFQGFILMWWRE